MNKHNSISINPHTNTNNRAIEKQSKNHYQIKEIMIIDSHKGNAITTEYTSDALLALIKSGKITTDDVADVMRQEKIERMLLLHEYEISQYSDGRWWTHVPDDTKKEGRRPLVKTRKEDLLDALVNYYLEPKIASKVKTLKDVFPLWLKEKEREGIAPDTLRKFNTHWGKYYLVSKVVDMPIFSLSLNVLKDWAYESIADNNPTQKEYINYTTIIRGCLDWCVEREIIPRNYFREIRINKKLFRKAKKKSYKTQVFRATELTALTELAWKDAYISNKRKHKLLPFALIFQLQTGLRVGELACVRYEDIDWDLRIITIQRMYRFRNHEITEYTKGSYGDRNVILTDEAIKAINASREMQKQYGSSTDGFIFSLYDNPPSYDAFHSLYSHYYDELGLGRRGTHICRRQYVTALLSSGVALDAVREACGHMSSQTTLDCYNYDMSADEEKINQFSKALDWKNRSN